MLTKFQKELMPLLMSMRSERSYFAGGSILNFSLPRCSSDFDIFHDDHTACTKSFITDVDMLRQNGYQVDILRTPEKHGIGEVVVSKFDDSGQSPSGVTQIQWATDSAYRFFPIEYDKHLGFCLNYHDLATNKILALAGRAEIRDYYDVCEMIQMGKPVTAYIWAACSKDPGYTPNSLLDYMSMNSKYRTEEFSNIYTSGKLLDVVQCKNLFQSMMHKARKQFSYAPIDEYGSLYLRKTDLSVFFPDKNDFESKNYIRHEARPFGAVPEFHNHIESKQIRR